MSGVSVAGHFGEWLQGRLGPDGPVVLVTLPCPVLAVQARAVPSDAFALDDGGLLGEARARHFLAELGNLPDSRVTLCADMPPGGGAGASTAALLALARVSGIVAGPEELARACLAAEGAVDPLMIDAPDTCLWASREAREIRRFAPMPGVEIVGGFLGPPQRTEAEDLRFPDISDLIEPWSAAASAGDRNRLAGLASMAAERTTALRGPMGDPTARLAAALGAIGHLRAHTGSARGLIFAPGTAPETGADHERGGGHADRPGD